MFQQTDTQPTGSGTIHSFLRIDGASSKNATQQGFNTDARPLQFDENKSKNFTRSLRLDELPQTTLNGKTYRVILLDINQKASAPLLSLDDLRVFVGGRGDLGGYANGKLAGLNPVYNLNAGAGADNWVKLNYKLNHGSGSGDMKLYVPMPTDFHGGEQGAAHAELTTWLDDHLADRAELVLVPTEYVGQSSTAYLDALAAGVPDGVPIAWTGDAVVNALRVSANQCNCSRLECLASLRKLSHNQHRLAERRGFLLDAAGVPQNYVTAQR